MPGKIAWFPNFCRLPVVFGVVLIAQLVAIVTVMAQRHVVEDTWDHLSLVSLFVQWIALLCAGTLCAARQQLTKLPVWIGLGAAWFIVVAITALGTVAAQWTSVSLGLSVAGIDSGKDPLAANLVIAGLVAAGALRYFYVQQQWLRSIEAQADSRISALQARIRPHFLYNSMNTVASLIPTRPELAERTIEDLSDLFRQVLSQPRREIQLGEELDMTRRYLAIEELRMGERLRIEWQVDALPRAIKVPPLILQPLVENCIYHGIQPLAEGGTLTVEGKVTASHWQIQLRNPVDSATHSERQGNGMAQDNIRLRLDHYYDGQGQFRVESSNDQYTVTIVAPLANPGESV